jgi:hypothetical protein
VSGDPVRRFWAKAMRGVPAKLHDAHIDDEALVDMAAAVHAAIAGRLGHTDFAFVAAIWSGTRAGDSGRDYILGRPVGNARPDASWLAAMLSNAARVARRARRP